MKNIYLTFSIFYLSTLLNLEADNPDRFTCAKNPMLAFDVATKQKKYHPNCIKAALSAAHALQIEGQSKNINPNFERIFKSWSPEAKDAYIAVLEERLSGGPTGSPINLFNKSLIKFKTSDETQLDVGSNVSSNQCTTNVSYAIRAALSGHPNLNCLEKAYKQIIGSVKRNSSFNYSWKLLSDITQRDVQRLIEIRLGIISKVSHENLAQLIKGLRHSFRDYPAAGPFTPKSL